MTVGLPFPRPAQTERYTFVAPIARGGMGYVELCFRREGRFLHWCARKRLHEQFRSDLRFRSMFMDEARLAGLVRHPNVVGVSDVGEDDDGPYLIMNYVEGVSLSRAIREMARARRAVPMQVAVRICREVSLGLHAAHEVRSEDGTVLHLVHRDVSPQNILIGFDGTVRVTDFGIAKALGNVNQTNAGVLKGNMGYLSPEQLRFEEPDRRSDFFSLGVTLYELLSGTRLYSNKDGFDGTRRILTEPPPDIGEIRSDVPAELVELLFEMLSKDRDARPSSGLDIATRLEGILAPLIAEEGSVTVADYMDQHFALQRQRHRGFLAEHLRRLEAQPAASARGTPASLPVSEMPAPPPRVRGRFRWLWIGAASTAAALALLAANRLGAW
ncbi:MAG TPA: serine/threonine-protein kinase, partial [Polyangia bacterium]|nr:serine/threonine-protein kinase [Polyangia bacterium]